MHRLEQMAAVCNETYLELSDAGDPSFGDARASLYKKRTHIAFMGLNTAYALCLKMQILCAVLTNKTSESYNDSHACKL